MASHSVHHPRASVGHWAVEVEGGKSKSATAGIDISEERIFEKMVSCADNYKNLSQIWVICSQRKNTSYSMKTRTVINLEINISYTLKGIVRFYSLHLLPTWSGQWQAQADGAGPVGFGLRSAKTRWIVCQVTQGCWKTFNFIFTRTQNMYAPAKSKG